MALFHFSLSFDFLSLYFFHNFFCLVLFVWYYSFHFLLELYFIQLLCMWFTRSPYYTFNVLIYIYIESFCHYFSSFSSFSFRYSLFWCLPVGFLSYIFFFVSSSLHVIPFPLLSSFLSYYVIFLALFSMFWFFLFCGFHKKNKTVIFI